MPLPNKPKSADSAEPGLLPIVNPEASTLVADEKSADYRTERSAHQIHCVWASDYIT